MAAAYAAAVQFLSPAASMLPESCSDLVVCFTLRMFVSVSVCLFCLSAQAMSGIKKVRECSKLARTRYSLCQTGGPLPARPNSLHGWRTPGYVCEHVCMCVYMSVHVYQNVCVLMNICRHACRCLCTTADALLYLFTHTCVRMSVYAHACMHAGICMDTHAHTCMCVVVCKHTSSLPQSDACLCMYTCM